MSHSNSDSENLANRDASNASFWELAEISALVLSDSVQSSSEYLYAVDIATQLTLAGHTAFFAGGCVRDFLLGRVPADYDVACDAPPKVVQALFGKSRTQFIGAAFGVVCVHGTRQGKRHSVEVATFRTDGSYSDGRHPDSVEFSDPQRDAERRDFTINGLFFDPARSEVVDFVGGRKDLSQCVVRAIGKPERRFGEDRLRMLRAIRFATRYGFVIEPKTLIAISAMAGEIGAVSPERIAVELRKMLTADGRAAALTLLSTTGLAQEIFPDWEILGATEEATARLANKLAKLDLAGLMAPIATVFAALLSESISVNYERVRESSDAFRARLKLSNNETLGIANTLLIANTILQADGLPWSLVQPALTHPDAASGLCLARATLAIEQLSLTNPSSAESERDPEGDLCSGRPSATRVRRLFKPHDFLRSNHSKAGNAELTERVQPGLTSAEETLNAADLVNRMQSSIHICQRALALSHKELDPPPLLDGLSLQKLGVRPGPDFALLLTEIRRQQLDGVLSTEQMAIEFVQSQA